MKNIKFIVLAHCISVFYSFGQTLNANGPGTTYEEINNFFAPGFTAIESPEQTTDDTPGSHPNFGRHIDEIFDASANKQVFRFRIHLLQDNDVSTTSTDRQRLEIKTYSPSPANMKATLGETVTYKWRFKLPLGFVPSTNFTHIHQLKAVGGDESDPIFTITVRKGTNNNPDFVQLINDAGANESATTLATADLSLFENNWVEVTETVFFSTTNGSYSITIKRLTDNTNLLSYSNSNLQTFRPTNTFVRPKWGIYRRMKDTNGTIISGLRDEEVLFSDFSIVEGVLSNSNFQSRSFSLKSTVITTFLEFDFKNKELTDFEIYTTAGVLVKKIKIKEDQDKINLEELQPGVYFLKNNQNDSVKFLKK